jgi:GntR family transcriptional regulator
MQPPTISSSRVTLIEDLFGQSVVEVHQQIAAGLIPPGLAEGLQVQAGATALEVQRTYPTG